MLKRIIAIFVIFLITAISWSYLGNSVRQRQTSMDEQLRKAVLHLWGEPQVQLAPITTYTAFIPASLTKKEMAELKKLQSKQPLGPWLLKENPKVLEAFELDGKTFYGKYDSSIHPLSLEGSDIKVHLDLQPRKKGLFWFPTYKVHFESEYLIRNRGETFSIVSFQFPFPNGSTVDIVNIQVGDKTLDKIDVFSEDFSRLKQEIILKPGQTLPIKIAYNSKGMGEWQYNTQKADRVARNFSLLMTTNFHDVDFPEGTSSPTEKLEKENGWELTWSHDFLVSGIHAGMTIPEKIHPDYWVGRIIAHAPVALFLYFFLIFLLTTLKDITFHPVNYFFLGCSFFAYHMLLVYTVDLISLHLAFWIASAVSVFLVVTYMRIVVGPRYAFVESTLAQLVTLVLFSYTFFFEGITGLTITILCILLLFIAMQTTAKIDWAEKFADVIPTPQPRPPYTPKPATPRTTQSS